MKKNLKNLIISKFKKPIILSTGLNDLKSIKNSVKIIEKNKINISKYEPLLKLYDQAEIINDLV